MPRVKNTKQCPACRRFFQSKGYPNHVKHCKSPLPANDSVADQVIIPDYHNMYTQQYALNQKLIGELNELDRKIKCRDIVLQDMRAMVAQLGQFIHSLMQVEL